MRLSRIIIALYGAAALGVWLGLWGADWQEISAAPWAGPSWDHWLGTNGLGQDLLARLLAGAAHAFEVGLVVALATTALATALGAPAGYTRSTWLDETVLWLIGTLEAVPFFLLLGALVFALQDHPWAIQLALILSLWTPTARLVRLETRRIRSQPYIDAARVAGLRPAAIVWRHVIPNIRHVLGIQAALSFVTALKVEVVLSFLGIGPADLISWGVMLAEAGQEVLAGHYRNLVATCLALSMLIFAFNHFADCTQRNLPRRSPRSAMDF